MSDVSQQYSYDRGPIYADLARSAIGSTVTLGPALFLDPLPVLFWIFLACGALFVTFGAKTLLKAVTSVSVDTTGLHVSGPLSRSVAWNELQSVKLRYYATRRKSDKGWMQLNLRDGSSKIVIDSGLSGFEPIARIAAKQVLDKDLEIDIPTQENFNALGIRMDDAQL